jgi:hypothetical protein
VPFVASGREKTPQLAGVRAGTTRSISVGGSCKEVPVSETLFGSAICAVGGARGGSVIPAWFDLLPRIGVRHAWLFWAVPAPPGSAAGLDELRADARRWNADLRSLGVSSELLIKRGLPAPWLTALAGICHAELIMAGPPAVRGGVSATLDELLASSPVPLLLLPDGGAPPEADLLLRPLVERGGTAAARALIDAWTEGRPLRHDFGNGNARSPGQTREALRLAIDLDATSFVVSGATPGLATRLVLHGSLPVLVVPDRLGLASARGGMATA